MSAGIVSSVMMAAYPFSSSYLEEGFLHLQDAVSQSLIEWKTGTVLDMDVAVRVSWWSCFVEISNYDLFSNPFTTTHANTCIHAHTYTHIHSNFHILLTTLTSSCPW